MGIAQRSFGGEIVPSGETDALPSDPPDAVRGLLRDFGQYLRERGEEVPADWSG